MTFFKINAFIQAKPGRLEVNFTQKWAVTHNRQADFSSQFGLEADRSISQNVISKTNQMSYPR